MNNKYTPEPWRVWNHDGDAIIEVLIPGTTDVYGDISTSLSPENASRIVACVNACAGIETEDIEAGKLGAILAGRIIMENIELLGSESLAVCAYRQGVTGVLKNGAGLWYYERVIFAPSGQHTLPQRI